jgi:hypothetical protein
VKLIDKTCQIFQKHARLFSSLRAGELDMQTVTKLNSDFLQLQTTQNEIMTMLFKRQQQFMLNAFNVMTKDPDSCMSLDLKRQVNILFKLDS